MARISVDVNEEWLKAAQEVLGTPTKVATINEALRSFADRKQAEAILDALDSVGVDVTDSAQGWRAGGRDLSRLAEDVRRDNVA
ncbi:type II toxin-antitoxin system VapB family antitoxin [Nocardia sp. NPDC058497]|uniref:type II toxin-antitoxin system VapB family antitoxin n=1 Tax=Nocardia sp. NPDC058497 TaxID=3346529 RepID=UPI003664743F